MKGGSTENPNHIKEKLNAATLWDKTGLCQLRHFKVNLAIKNIEKSRQH